MGSYLVKHFKHSFRPDGTLDVWPRPVRVEADKKELARRGYKMLPHGQIVRV